MKIISAGIALALTTTVASAGMMKTADFETTKLKDLKSDFSVFAGYSTSQNLANSTFSRGYEVISPDTTQKYVGVTHQVREGRGLGVRSFKGESSGLTSNLNNNYKKDEVIYFDFKNLTKLEKVWFNGFDKERVGKNAKFRIFASEDGGRYHSLTGGQKSPTNRDYMSVEPSEGYKWYAVAATGYGHYQSFIEGIKYSPVASVSEPGTFALLGLGLVSLGFARRSVKK